MVKHTPMARVCDICGKGYQKGNLVSFSNKKAIKRSHVNLRRVRRVIDGTSVRVVMCSGCLNRSKINDAELAVKKSEASLNTHS